MKLHDGRIYLDCNATTPVDPRVETVLEEASRAVFGNPSSNHREGRRALEVLERAREEVAAFAGSRPGEVVFTSSGTEANHLALRSAALAGGPGNRVLLSSIEHPSVLEQRPELEAAGFAVEEIPVTAAGTLDVDALAAALDGRVSVVSVMAAHNETGALQPLPEVRSLCDEHGALFHTDAVQAAGKVPLPWSSARPDYMVLAAHKMYGPKGIAALVTRRGAPLAPMLRGGNQEGGARSSTQAVPLAMAMAETCTRASETFSRWKTVKSLRDRLEDRLRDLRGARVFGAKAPRLPNTSFLHLPGWESAELVARLDAAGFAVSSGSACHGGEARRPRVLDRMGIGEAGALSPLRISLGRETSMEDVEAFLQALLSITQGEGEP